MKIKKLNKKSKKSTLAKSFFVGGAMLGAILVAGGISAQQFGNAGGNANTNQYNTQQANNNNTVTAQSSSSTTVTPANAISSVYFGEPTMVNDASNSSSGLPTGGSFFAVPVVLSINPDINAKDVQMVTLTLPTVGNTTGLSSNTQSYQISYSNNNHKLNGNLNKALGINSLTGNQKVYTFILPANYAYAYATGSTTDSILNDATITITYTYDGNTYTSDAYGGSAKPITYFDGTTAYTPTTPTTSITNLNVTLPNAAGGVGNTYNGLSVSSGDMVVQFDSNVELTPGAYSLELNGSATGAIPLVAGSTIYNVAPNGLYQYTTIVTPTGWDLTPSNGASSQAFSMSLVDTANSTNMASTEFIYNTAASNTPYIMGSGYTGGQFTHVTTGSTTSNVGDINSLIPNSVGNTGIESTIDAQQLQTGANYSNLQTQAWVQDQFGTKTDISSVPVGTNTYTATGLVNNEQVGGNIDSSTGSGSSLTNAFYKIPYNNSTMKIPLYEYYTPQYTINSSITGDYTHSGSTSSTGVNFFTTQSIISTPVNNSQIQASNVKITAPGEFNADVTVNTGDQINGTSAPAAGIASAVTGGGIYNDAQFDGTTNTAGTGNPPTPGSTTPSTKQTFNTVSSIYLYAQPITNYGTGTTTIGTQANQRISILGNSTYGYSPTTVTTSAATKSTSFVPLGSLSETTGWTVKNSNGDSNTAYISPVNGNTVYQWTGNVSFSGLAHHGGYALVGSMGFGNMTPDINPTAQAANGGYYGTIYSGVINFGIWTPAVITGVTVFSISVLFFLSWAGIAINKSVKETKKAKAAAAAAGPGDDEAKADALEKEIIEGKKETKAPAKEDSKTKETKAPAKDSKTKETKAPAKEDSKTKETKAPAKEDSKTKETKAPAKEDSKTKETKAPVAKKTTTTKKAPAKDSKTKETKAPAKEDSKTKETKAPVAKKTTTTKKAPAKKPVAKKTTTTKKAPAKKPTTKKPTTKRNNVIRKTIVIKK